MIVVGLIVAIAFGFAAGWGWRHLDPQRKDVKGLFGTLLDRYALGNSTHDYEVMMLKSKLALANTRISSLELMLETAKIVGNFPGASARKPGTKNHVCHDTRCQGYGLEKHFCHDGDCGRVSPPYDPTARGRTNTCSDCGAPPGVPCWEERHGKSNKKKRTSP